MPARCPSTDTYSDTDAMHGQMLADTKAASNSALSSGTAVKEGSSVIRNE